MRDVSKVGIVLLAVTLLACAARLKPGDQAELGLVEAERTRFAHIAWANETAWKAGQDELLKAERDRYARIAWANETAWKASQEELERALAAAQAKGTPVPDMSATRTAAPVD